MTRRGATPPASLPVRCSAFGLDITSSLPFPGDWRSSGRGLPALVIESAEPEAVASAWSGAAALGWRGRVDGGEFLVEHGAGGDLRMRFADTLDLHLSASGSRLLVAGDGSVASTRVLLDSALFTASLHRGYEALHAGAVVADDGALAVVGGTGAGKSSLVAALLRAGCSFFTDDVLVLRRRGPAILAQPGPPVMTVPSLVSPGFGEPLAELGGEAWLAVAGAASELPLAGIVALDGAGAGWTWVIRQLLRFPSTRSRERSRFELAADIATRTPLRRMAPRSAAPDVLAASALEWLRSI